MSFFRHQLSLAPNSIFNIANNNNGYLLAVSNYLGLETVTAASQPIIDFLKANTESSAPVPNGSFVERYLWEMKKNEENGVSDSAFYGRRGYNHLQSTLLDMFLAGTVVRTRIGRLKNGYWFNVHVSG